MGLVRSMIFSWRLISTALHCLKVLVHHGVTHQRMHAALVRTVVLKLFCRLNLFRILKARVNLGIVY